MPSRRTTRNSTRRAPAESTSNWQKVTTFAGVGRLAVAVARLVRDWLNGEGPWPFL